MLKVKVWILSCRFKWKSSTIQSTVLTFFRSPVSTRIVSRFCVPFTSEACPPHLRKKKRRRLISNFTRCPGRAGRAGLTELISIIKTHADARRQCYEKKCTWKQRHSNRGRKTFGVWEQKERDSFQALLCKRCFWAQKAIRTRCKGHNQIILSILCVFVDRWIVKMLFLSRFIWAGEMHDKGRSRGRRTSIPFNSLDLCVMSSLVSAVCHRNNPLIHQLIKYVFHVGGRGLMWHALICHQCW